MLDEIPRTDAEVLTFVAHYGSRVARMRTDIPLERIVVRALRAARRDPGLARTLPLFLWRIRRELDLERLIELARRSGQAAVLGYFLELAAGLGRVRSFGPAIRQLRPLARSDRPRYLFPAMARNPFAAMLAETRSPLAALRWGLLTGTPTDSYESYFRKVARA